MEERIYLKKARLKGYKSIIDTEASFLPGINIIIGDNGSGKTNFLEFLDYAIEFILPESVAGDFLINIGLDFLKGNDKNKLLEWEVKGKINYVSSTTKGDAFADLVPEITGICSINYNGEKHSLISNQKFKSVEDFLENAETEIDNYSANIDIPIFSVSVIYYGVPEEIDTWYRKGLDLRVHFGKSHFNLSPLNSRLPIRHLFKLSSFPTGTITTDGINDMEKLPQRIANSFKEGFNKTYQDIISKHSPVKDIRINPYFNTTSNNQIVVAKNLHFEFLLNDEWLTWDSLSDGTQRLLYIIVEVLTSNSEIILIEEPELGLYPQQLNLLLDLIKGQSATKQFIISTHSPQILDILTINQLDRINVVKMTKEGTKIERLTKEQKELAVSFYNSTGIMSDYWRFDNLGL